MTCPPTGSLRFNGIIRILGINPFVRVTAARARTLQADWRRPMPVLVRVNGHPKSKPWRINMMPMGNGDFYLYLHGDVRRASDTAVGSRVTVDLKFDSEYRNGPLQPVPAWFRQALGKNPKARSAWQELIPSRKKEILRYFSQLKTAEARSRNLKRAIGALAGTTPRFMGRDW
ncbi:MAG: YdeI/OmpD-associated family protein [Gemmatimonadota bacterium]